MAETFLHHNNGVKALRYTVRVNREIRKVFKAPVNTVLVTDSSPKESFLLTKGTFEVARKLGRLKLVPYVGNWPRVALIVKRIKEIVND
ncbi:hypothetical protein KJF94_16135 [Pseudomonas hormoni]|uniref:Uncharacterized protein n=1 Tax=Pseudomonas hormoni TaxID=3093767 RepID=A0ABX8ERZ3_9PSED|nr:hypothetical protein [Pseudomonas hormoni]QVW21442.1 hypothetical protein KJF94_16135 [Pseudomonas hormoni]